MEFEVDVLLRGEKSATTHLVKSIHTEPASWTDADVALVLKEMLRAVDRMKNPSLSDREVFLRGVSWIVEASTEGGVVIALEIPTGAAIAGPFDISRSELETMIARVLAARPRDPAGPTIH